MKRLVAHLTPFFLSIFCLLSIANSAIALDQPFRVWTYLSKTGDFANSDFSYRLLTTQRFGNVNSLYHQGLYLGAYGYHFTPRFTLWLGTDSVFTLSRNNQWFYEQRLWPETDWTIIQSPHFKLTWRTREELRFLHQQPGIGLRWRNRLQAAFPNAIEGKLTPIVFEELMINVNHPAWVGPNVLNQNRAFAGIQFPFTRNTKMLIGYLNQYIWVPRRTNRMAHILYVAWLF